MAEKTQREKEIETFYLFVAGLSIPNKRRTSLSLSLSLTLSRTTKRIWIWIESWVVTNTSMRSNDFFSPHDPSSYFDPFLYPTLTSHSCNFAFTVLFSSFFLLLFSPPSTSLPSLSIHNNNPVPGTGFRYSP